MKRVQRPTTWVSPIRIDGVLKWRVVRGGYIAVFTTERAARDYAAGMVTR